MKHTAECPFADPEKGSAQVVPIRRFSSAVEQRFCNSFAAIRSRIVPSLEVLIC